MNMRKIVAMLAAVLMLCAAIPMGALSVAADGEVVIDYNFDDGVAHFERGYVENGYMVFDGTTDSWQNAYLYANAMKANTDYVATFTAKADKDASLGLKINNNWAGDTAEKYVSVTTEWQDFEIMFNTSELADLTSTAIVMFYSPYDAANAPIYCIDNLKIEEYVAPVVPGTVINGDFETGNTDGWNIHQNVTVTEAAAHDGSYGAHLQDNGTWGGIMDQTVPVEAGKSYEISFWIRVNQTGINLQIKDGDASGASLASGTWYDYNSHSTWTQKTYIVTPSTDAIFFNFCGAGNGTPDPAKVTNTYIDSFTVKELKEPSNDGYITNGDFEVGDLQGWDPLWWASNISLVEDGYNSAYAMKFVSGGDYQLVRQLVNVEPNTDYVIQCYAKNVDNMTLLVKSAPADQNMKQTGMNGSDWTLNTLEFNSGDNTQVYVGVMGNVADATAIVDSITMAKKGSEPEQPEEPENAVIWNVNFNDGEKKFNVGEVVAEGPDGSNCYKWAFGGGWDSNWTGGLSMDYTKDYTITMKVKASADSSMGITLQTGSWGAYWNGPSFGVTTEWQEVVLTLPANTVPIESGNTLFKFQGTGASAYTLYVDDIVISEGLPAAPENFLNNGDFETGNANGWENLWGSNTIEIVEGIDGGSALSIVSGQWKHVRQTGIAVKTNTWYKLTAWAKDAKGMSLLVKNGADSVDIVNKGIEAEEWTEFTVYFNTGDFNSIIFSLMGNNAEEAFGTFDNIVLKQLDCEFVEEIVDPTCEEAGSKNYTCECGESFSVEIPAYHNGGLEYHAAVEAIDCANPGNIEHWYCPGCHEYFADAEATEMLNPWFINITVDCVRPEGIADCATVTCETCGNEIYGYGEHDVLACQGGTCSKCGDEIEGYGCANYDTPACEDGVCYYCGGFVAGFGHENGAFAPCVDGECAYGCGLQYPATEDHVDEDGDDYCDNCWNHLACIDEDGNGECDVCWSPMPHDCIDTDADGFCDICWSEMPDVEIIYGDANGDGEISTMDVVILQQYTSGATVEGMNEAAADANGDGEITTMDVVLLQQLTSGWDVVLGPQG